MSCGVGWGRWVHDWMKEEEEAEKMYIRKSGDGFLSVSFSPTFFLQILWKPKCQWRDSCCYSFFDSFMSAAKRQMKWRHSCCFSSDLHMNFRVMLFKGTNMCHFDLLLTHCRRHRSWTRRWAIWWWYWSYWLTVLLNSSARLRGHIVWWQRLLLIICRCVGSVFCWSLCSCRRCRCCCFSLQIEREKCNLVNIKFVCNYIRTLSMHMHDSFIHFKFHFPIHTVDSHGIAMHQMLQ